MDRRLELQKKLVELLGSDFVYFQPPPTVKMEYPCIVYKRDFILSNWADGNPYHIRDRYLVTLIHRDPDSNVIHKLAALPLCVYERFYTANNLNHNVFKLFF